MGGSRLATIIYFYNILQLAQQVAQVVLVCLGATTVGRMLYSSLGHVETCGIVLMSCKQRLYVQTIKAGSLGRCE